MSPPQPNDKIKCLTKINLNLGNRSSKRKFQEENLKLRKESTGNQGQTWTVIQFSKKSLSTIIRNLNFHYRNWDSGDNVGRDRNQGPSLVN
jgi:hypothetical protein